MRGREREERDKWREINERMSGKEEREDRENKRQRRVIGR